MKKLIVTFCVNLILSVFLMASFKVIKYPFGFELVVCFVAGVTSSYLIDKIKM